MGLLLLFAYAVASYFVLRDPDLTSPTRLWLGALLSAPLLMIGAVLLVALYFSSRDLIREIWKCRLLTK